jgi:hypothetical protein
MIRPCLLLACLLPALSQLRAETRVFLLLGQSNAVGKGDAALLPTSPIDYTAAQVDIPFWYEGGSMTGTRDASSGWTTLRPQTNTYGAYSVSGIIAPATGHGLELSFGRALADSGNLGGDAAAVLKFALNGSSLYLNWNPDNAATTGYYDDFLAKFTTAYAALPGPKTLGGVIWVQGETDAKSGGGTPPPQPATANDYQANLTAFISRVRADLASPALPFLIVRLGQLGNPSSGSAVETTTGQFYAYRDTIRAAQTAVADASTTDATAWVDADGLAYLGDYLHLTSASQVTLGQRCANAWRQLHSNLQLQSWRTGYGLPIDGSGDGANTADPDADGIKNLLEYALGGIPTQPSTGILPAIGTATAGPQKFLTLSFTRARADVTYTVEASSDLLTWPDTVPFTLPAPGASATATDTVDMLTNPHRFLRLRVSQP